MLRHLGSGRCRARKSIRHRLLTGFGSNSFVAGRRIRAEFVLQLFHPRPDHDRVRGVSGFSQECFPSFQCPAVVFEIVAQHQPQVEKRYGVVRIDLHSFTECVYSVRYPSQLSVTGAHISEHVGISRFYLKGLLIEFDRSFVIARVEAHIAQLDESLHILRVRGHHLLQAGYAGPNIDCYISFVGRGRPTDWNRASVQLPRRKNYSCEESDSKHPDPRNQ